MSSELTNNINTDTSDTTNNNHTSMNGHNKDETHTSELPSTNGTPVNGIITTETAVNNRNRPHRSLKSKSHFLRNQIFRIVGFDIPFIIVFIIYLSIHHLYWLSTNYLVPLNSLQYFDTHERDITYYHRICTKDDQTTHDTADLLVDIHSSSSSSSSSSNNNNNNDTTNTKAKIDIAVQKMLRHGVTIIPHLISESTATELRDYILEQNQIQDHLIFVIENQFRWSFPIQVDQHPIISRALQEILVQNNPNLLSYLEAVMGSNPAVIEFTAITQAYGAKEQFWHQDVIPSGSAVKYGRKYIPSYSLFIPLQNVTAEMGATGICPGTHMCSESEFCTSTGFQTSGKNNNWPLGYGAFVNQQTTHRGSAHRDPNGPHRVVFILTFAPRPLTFQPYSVETRLIGSGGSYSLHWSQWGHTVYDYQNPLQRMKQPYRTLRSLGLYNPYGSGNSNWGWDYITVSSARIANEDVGFTPGDFDDFISKGGLTWLPKYLQGNATIPSDDSETPYYGWLEFLLETVTKCKLEITKVYYACLGGYAGCLLLFVIISGRGTRLKAFMNNTFRICLIHAALLFGAWFVRHNVIHSTWGRNIQAHRSFRLSNRTLAMAPSLPATLPTEDDVLIFEGMQSESLSSFSRVLDVFHPGNREWNDLLDQMSPGYDRLPSALQAHVRYRLLKMIESKKSRRVLIQTDHYGWASATPEIRQLYCHKSLLQKSNPYVNHILQSLDNALSDIRFGYWRDTVLHQKHVSQFVYNLRTVLMQMQFSVPRQQSLHKDWYHRNNPIAVHHELFFVRKFGTKRIHQTLSKSAFRNQTSSSPSTDATQAVPTSWLSAGDIAEASFFDDITEWYRCTIQHASANRGVWDVIYDDGDTANDLCRTCVRPFIPYTINETIDVLVGADLYVPSRVVAIHRVSNDLVYDVELEDDSNQLIKNVPSKGLRRNYRKESDDESSILPPQTLVMALYRDDDGNAVDYFPGRIIQYNANRKSYDIEFDDGDVAHHIRRHDIELMAKSQ